MTGGEHDPGLQELFERIGRTCGLGCEAYKASCLRRRIAVRMRACGVQTYAQYGAVLDGDASEYGRLLDTLTINVTKFYRNPETWEVIARRVLPELWVQRDGQVRCWSAGCASGEEAYTMAMLLLERARGAGDPAASGSGVDASDLDRKSLARAAEGVYRAEAFDEMPPTLVRRYVQGEASRRMAPEVKALVRFLRHDLLREPPPAPPYELIMCRNVVIYFDRPTQDALFQRFVEALVPGGYLVLGKVETLVGEARNQLVIEDTRERIYRKP